MAKNKVYIDIVVDDKGTTKKVAVNAKKLEKALEGTGRAAQTADRNLKGAAKASANGTKNFSKMAQGISGGIVPAYATLAAQIFAVSAAFHFLKSASDISNLIAGQEALGSVSGVAYKTLTQGLKEATDGQISYSEAAKAAAIGTASGLSPDQLNRLGAAAKNTSIALGRDLTDSFNRLVRGVTKAEPELLDELGIILRLEEAKKNYAEQIGKTAGELNQFERSQAVANEVLDQAESKFGAIAAELDPSVTALNKFLVSFDNVINSIKQGTIKVLRPLFVFLSQNTAALTASLGLFAVPIIRSILPAFDDWKEKSVETLKAVQGNQKKWQDSLEATRKKMKALDKSAEEQRKDATNASQGVLSKIGVTADPSKPSSAASFFAGKTPAGTDAKSIKARNRAILNAEKVLANARININATTGKVISGVIKGATLQDIAVLEHKAAIEKKNIKEIEAIHGSAYAKMKLQVKGFGISAVATFQGIRASAIAAGTAVATFGTRLLSAFSWIGLIVLAVQGFIAVWKKFNPVPDAIREANAATEKFIGSTKTLNEELDGMIRVANKGLLDLEGSVLQVGKALGSSDLKKKIDTFKNLSPDSDDFEEAEEALIGTITRLGELDSRFKDFGKGGSQAIIAQREEIIKLANSIQNVTLLMEQEKQLRKDINTEIENLSGKGLVIDTTIVVRGKLDSLINTIDLKLKEFRQQAKQQLETSGGRKEELQEELSSLQTVLDKQKENRAFYKTQGFILTGTDERIHETLDLMGPLGKELRKILNDEAFIAEQIEEQTKLREIAKQKLDIFTDLSEKLVKLSKRQISNQEEINNLKTAGLSASGKLLNIEASEVAAQNKLLDKSREIIEAKGAKQSLLLDLVENYTKLTEEERKEALKGLDDNKKAQLDAANNAINAAEQGKRNTEVEVDLQKVKNRILKAGHEAEVRFNTEVLSEKLRMTKQEFDIINKINQAKKDSFNIGLKETQIRQQAELREAKGGFGFDFIDQGKLKIEQQIAIEREKIKYEEQVQSAIDESKKKIIEAEYNLLEAQLRVSAAISTQKGLELLSDGDKTNDPLGEELLASALLQEQLASELNVSETIRLMSENLDKARANRINGSEERIKALEQQKENLGDIGQLLDSLESSLTTGLSSAFDSVIQGTESMKGAFGNMAISVLKSLSQVISKLLAIKLLQAVGLPGFSQGGVVEQARTGGVFSQGEKMQGFSTGGVAKGREAGYPVMLHGTEAVVPLPNNREIPVQLMGGTGQNNNVTVNLSMDSNGAGQQASEQDSQQAGMLGKAIAQAVQKELQNQKRSGGILNPYGVA
jgi:hypothetical protein